MKRKKGPRRGEDFELNQAMVKADFWLLFFSFFCGVGTGVTAINNLGQIGAAQGYSDVTMFVTLFGVFNFLGRLGGGSVSEYYIRWTFSTTHCPHFCKSSLVHFEFKLFILFHTQFHGPFVL